jgi:hypothetical protein
LGLVVISETRRQPGILHGGLTGRGSQFFEDPSVKDSLLGFVYIGNESCSRKIPLGTLSPNYKAALEQSDWKFLEVRGECRKTFDPMALFAKPTEFTQAFAEWWKTPLEQANEILEKSYSCFNA